MFRRFLWLLLILLTACSAATEPDGVKTSTSVSSTVQSVEKSEISPLESTTITTTLNRRVDVEDNYSFPFSLGFDSIHPVYSPEFAPASNAPLEGEELVLGIAWDGEAKAYPISVLRYREMVDDELAGIPTLVTW